MGYYQGSGIVSGGSSIPSSGGGGSLPRMNIRFFIKKVTKTTTTKYPGVSLNTAKGKTGINNMKARAMWESNSNGYFFDIIFPDCSGNSTSYSYAQIGDSNLYELVETYTEVTASVDTNIESF